jgi:hypothetical protein
MAEDEIRKHANSAFKIMKDPQTDWKHKLKDVVLEILIIVFAVTISIWFHNWSDKMHDQKEEEEFLKGYRTDLAGDIVNIQSSLEFYQNAFRGMQYFGQVGSGDTLSNDSLKKYTSIFFSSTTLEAHTSRYEALKSSGKLGIIQDPELLNNIIDLNESTLARIQMLNDLYLKFVYKTSDYIQVNAQLSPRGAITNAPSLLRNSQWRFLMNFGQASLIQNIIPAQQDGIKKCKALLQEIDKESK